MAHHAGDHHVAAVCVLSLAQLDGGNGHGADLGAIAIERMAGDVKSQALFLQLEPLPGEKLFHFGQRDVDFRQGRLILVEVVEEGFLAIHLAIAELQSHRHHLVQPGQHAGPVGCDGIERTALDQGLHHTLVHLVQVDRLDERGQVRKPPIRLAIACQENHLHGIGADIFHGVQTETHRPIVDGEIQAGGVDVRRQYRHPHGTAFGNEIHHLVRVVHVAAEQGRHVLHRVMGLEVGSLVGDEAVGCRVGFIESVTREVIDQVEYFIGLVPLDIPVGASQDEHFTLLGHLSGNFLADGPAQDIRLSQRKPSKHLHRLDHLLLVDHHAVGLLQHRFQQRMGIGWRPEALLALHEFGDHPRSQRPRAVEGQNGHDVLEAGGLHIHHQAAHAAGFELEDPGHLPLAQHLESLFVVEGNGIDIESITGGAAAVYQAQRLADGREVEQAEKVEFHRALLFSPRHRVLGLQAIALGRCAEGYDLLDVGVHDDHAGCVGGKGVVQALQRLAVAY